MVAAALLLAAAPPPVVSLIVVLLSVVGVPAPVLVGTVVAVGTVLSADAEGPAPPGP